MKKFAKSLVAKILWYQVKRLSKKNSFKVVGVAGSVGKTSTKFAIAKLLSQKFRVQSQEGNYNDLVSVPLIYFGQDLPSLFNPVAWLSVFIKNEKILRSNYPYDVVVIELGTDAPGQMTEFKPYLTLDVGVLTAITPEHMQFFETLDDVAKEELEIARMTKTLYANKDYCDQKYLSGLAAKINLYSASQKADVYLDEIKYEQFSANFSVKSTKLDSFDVKHEMIVEPLLESIVGAIAVAIECGLNKDEIKAGLDNIKPVYGRMNRLEGVNGSTIIDDTYNASPEAVKAALKTLYRIKAPHKIAVLGNMNELGQYSEAAHREIGQLCDPKQIDLLVTIGKDANLFLAAAAKSNGCQVETFDDPYLTGDYISQHAKEGSLILIKGSQNNVYAEETAKVLLANTHDVDKLVRQSPYWLQRKKQAFAK